jgi:ABC-type dipeptide/oligopeptide/nickel transport system permease subunit
MKTYPIKHTMKKIYKEKDLLWSAIWFGGMVFLWIWDILFLNAPALERFEIAFINTFLISVMTIVFATLLSYLFGFSLEFLKEWEGKLYTILSFVADLIRSVPQIIGILLGYIILTLIIKSEVIGGVIFQIVFIAFTVSVFVFLEVSDLIQERIQHYKKSDFYSAMLSCGIKESRIINREILLKNSLPHILHKLISIFGITIFLLCSIDFVISVGLSTDVSLSNFPPTLGSLLAKMDSKQDILAIGTFLTDLSYFPKLFFEHLQGVSVAFSIVFTLLCVYKISSGFIKRLD